MAHPSVCVVIPHWNGKKILGKSLDSLLAQSFPATVIVVDNGSTDGSQDLVKKSYPQVVLIERDKNYGFTGGVNPGIELAIAQKADYVALFNNDAVADKDWLKSLVAAAQANPKAGIITSKIMLMDKKHLDSTGEFYTVWGLPFSRGRHEADEGQYDKQVDVFSASGGATLYRTAMFKQIGLFDQAFFAYFEDVDISFRAQLAGWKVVFEPTAVAYHAIGTTSSQHGNFSTYHSSKNFILLYAKNMPIGLFFLCLPFFLLQLARWFVTSLLRGKIWAFLKGMSVGLLLTPSTFIKRWGIQKKRTVPVSYIRKQLVWHRPPKPARLENV